MSTERFPLMVDDVEVIGKLGDRPGAENGLPPEGLKAKFDEGPRLLKIHLNKIIEKLNTILAGEGQILPGGNVGGDINMNQYRLWGLAEPKQVNDAARKADVDNAIKFADTRSTWVFATLGTSWTGSGPYTQTVSVPGIPAEAKAVTCWPEWAADAATREKQREAWNAVSRIVPSAGAIAFTCDDDKPVTAVPMRIEVQL